MKVKLFSRDDVLNFVCEMANRSREEHKDDQDDMFFKGVIVALESVYRSLERFSYIEIEEAEDENN